MKLPEKILTIHELIKNCSTTGAALAQLPVLLQALKEAKETKKYMVQLEKQADDASRKWVNHNKEFHAWLLAKLDCLKMSKFAGFPLVKQSIKQANDVLCFRVDEYYIDYFNSALNVFKNAAYAVAGFGADPLFDGWAQVGSQEVFARDLELNFTLKAEGKIVMTHKEKQTLVTKLGHGIESWEVECWEVEKYDGPDGRPLFSAHLRKGYVQYFNLPDCYRRVFSYAAENALEQDHHKWLERTERDPVALYSLLETLSTYVSIDPLELSSNSIPKNVDEAISLQERSQVGLYLSSFSQHDPQRYFQSHGDILRLIGLFVSHVGLHSNRMVVQAQKKQQPIRGKGGDRFGPDRYVCVDFLKGLRAENPGLQQGLAIDKLRTAIATGKVVLTVQPDGYSDTTYKDWDRQADQASLEEKLTRKKSKNR